MNEKDTPQKKEEMVAVNCSYCGKEIECPVSMLSEVEKHACFACFESLPKDKNKKAKVHVDIPVDEAIEDIAGKFAEKQTQEFFPKMWAEHKEEIKEMSKRELAEKVFNEGIYTGFIGALAYPSTEGDGADEESEEGNQQ